MILMTEKKVEWATGKKMKTKMSFSGLSNALRYAADWMDVRSGQVGVVTWKNKVKFGFYTDLIDGYQEEISFEEIPEADPG